MTTKKDLKTHGGALVLERGDLVMLDDARALVAQAIQARLSTLRGTRPWDASYGPDLLGQVFVKNPDLEAISALLKAEITSVAGVSRLLSYEQVLTGRAFSVTFTVEVEGDAAAAVTLQLSLSSAARAQLVFNAHL